MEEKEIEFCGVTTNVILKEGGVKNYEKMAGVVTLGSEGSIEVELQEPTRWDDDEALAQAIQDSFVGDPDWPDTLYEDWEPHSRINPDTQVWDVVWYVLNTPYCTTEHMDRDLDLNGNIQNVVYKAKNLNMIKAVGREGNKHILVCTHLAYKEILEEHSLGVVRSLFKDDGRYNTEDESQSLADFK